MSVKGISLELSLIEYNLFGYICQLIFAHIVDRRRERNSLITGSRVDSKFSYILDISGLAASQVTSTSVNGKQLKNKLVLSQWRPLACRLIEMETM